MSARARFLEHWQDLRLPGRFRLPTKVATLVLDRASCPVGLHAL